MGEVELSSKDRIFIFAPHPDDEVVGCSGIVQKALEMNIPVRIVFLTCGDANEWSFLIYEKKPVLEPEEVVDMGKMRHGEALNAAKITGIPEENLTFLGYPDFGCLHIFAENWDESEPYESILTRVKKVPYKFAFHPSSPYKGEEILSDIKELMEDFGPTKIFVTHPSDHHPDHQAFYLFTMIALWDLQDKIDAEVYPYLVHYTEWPDPEGFFPEKPLDPPLHLNKNYSWETSNLAEEELTIKEKAMKAHKSQFEAATKLLSSFLRANELFGNLPVLDLPSEKIQVPVKEKMKKIPEDLLEEKDITFIGLEKQTIEIKDKRLIIFLDLTGPLMDTSEFSVYLFGYKDVRDFSVMPKIHIKVSSLDFDLYDQQTKLSKDSLDIKRDSDKMTLSIPVDVLENPDKIIMGTKLYEGELLVDWSPWRVIDVKNN